MLTELQKWNNNSDILLECQPLRLHTQSMLLLLAPLQYDSITCLLLDIFVTTAATAFTHFRWSHTKLHQNVWTKLKWIVCKQQTLDCIMCVCVLLVLWHRRDWNVEWFSDEKYIQHFRFGLKLQAMWDFTDDCKFACLNLISNMSR